MLRFLAVPLMLAGVLGAQNPAKLFEKAPPDVEAALRERITGFFQAHVNAKFRQADQFVAEDTRDYYYEANKPRYLSFEILDITWSGNFTRAKVKVLVEQRVMIPGFADRP